MSKIWKAAAIEAKTQEEMFLQGSQTFVAGARWLLEQARLSATKPSKKSTTQFKPFIEIAALENLVSKGVKK